MGKTHAGDSGPVSPAFLGPRSSSGDACPADGWLYFQDLKVLASFYIFPGYHLEAPDRSIPVGDQESLRPTGGYPRARAALPLVPLLGAGSGE